MATTLIKSSKNGYDPSKLTDQQRAFVLELLGSALFCPTEAARKAGYSNPKQRAYRLLKHPKIQQSLGKAQRDREERCQLTADDVLNYLRSALFLNPLDYFRPTEDGRWLVTDPDSLPEEVGRLIESIRVKVRERDDGTLQHEFEVQLVSKATALSLAMKHTTVEQHKVQHEVKQVIPWDALYRRMEQPDTDIIVEQIVVQGEPAIEDEVPDSAGPNGGG